MSALYPNYFFIGALLTFIFLLYVVFLIWRIQNRSLASKHLMIAMILAALFNLSYVVTHGIYTLPNAVTRWVNFYTAMSAGLHLSIFFHAFPTVRSRKVIRYTLWIGYATVFASCGYLAYAMANSPYYYLFNSHFWDSDSLPAQKLVSFAIVLHFVHFIVIGVWRGFKEHGEERSGIWTMAFAFLFATIPPAILQVLSRDNLVARSTFMTTTVIFNLVGYFVAIVVFINITKDKTSLLGRITGITLLTVLLLFQSVAYYWMHFTEESFDKVRAAEVRESYSEGKKPKEAVLEVIYDYAQKKMLTPVEPTYASAAQIQRDASALYLVHTLLSLAPKPDWKTQAKLSVGTIEEFSPIQAAYLQKILEKESVTSGKDFVDAVFALRSQQLYQQAKLHQMTLNEFSKNLPKTLAKLEKNFPGFSESTNSRLAALSPEEQRQKISDALTPWRAEGERLYRGNIYFREKFPAHFVSFSFVDVQKHVVVEVAYPYLLYREAIAEQAWILVLIILTAYAIIVLGFSLFFRGALMKPVNSIVEGLKEINRNNFDVRVRARVEDELGFMARSFNRMARSIKVGRLRLQKYAEGLEEKVKERTQELETTLTDVRALKQQQDGDYFLTTLLLKPLGVNAVESAHFGIETFVKQKKTFDFRHWSRDIGGDINISHTIDLYGKKHIVLINADAMGKSIQGAGGALVLGSVFHTIIERTQATEAMRQISPERWLKNAFLELHRVFESFDGSMLVSGFFALIDENTGLMYHLLAEHPRAVLYRDGKASFLENDRMLRKLGTTGVVGTLGVATTQLEPGDVLFLGSDGRDDIILGVDEFGGRIINEDENLFLHLVENADGKIEDIVRAMEAMGEIMDDLSLMRIEHFREEHPVKRPFDYESVFSGVKRDIREGNTPHAIGRIEAYLKQDTFYPQAIKNLAQIYYQTHDYEKAARYAQDYLWLKPADAEFVYFAGLCFRRIKDYSRAIDLCERLRLREIPLAKNLALLCDLYIRTGNLQRAEAILKELERIDNTLTSISLLKRKLADAAV